MNYYNILFFSSGRSDYELIKPIIERLKKQKNYKIFLVLTGSHFSKIHGETFRQIKIANVKVIKIDIKCDNVNLKNFNKNFIFAQNKYEKFIKKNFDLAVILGDRYEALAFGLSCFFKGIKIAHLHGGELTNGAIDDTLRHSLTKLSDIHFVSNNQHRKRVIQLGENPKTVKNVGLIGFENIAKMKFLKKKVIFQSLKINEKRENILISYHPVTKLSSSENKIQFKQLLISLKNLHNFNLIFTSPNIDPGNREIVKEIKKNVKKYDNFYFFHSLGQLKYFSLAQSSKLFIGNSSSGILEIPFLNVPVINVGSRQSGRYNFNHIYHVSADHKKISAVINNLLQRKYRPNNNVLKKNTSLIIKREIVKFLKKRTKPYEKTFFDLKKI